MSSIPNSRYRIIVYKTKGEFFIYDKSTDTKFYITDFKKQEEFKQRYKVEEYNLSPVEDILIAITGRCNQKCKHCAGESPLNFEIKTDKFIQLIGNLKRLGALRIYLTGGEIFMHDDIFNFLDVVVQNGLTIQIGTNGTLLDKYLIKRLEDYPVTLIGVSLDGAEPSTHDRFRSMNGSFKKTWTALKNLSPSTLPTRVVTCLHTDVLDELPYMINQLRNINIKEWLLSEIFPLGRAAKNASSIMPSLKLIKSAVKNILSCTKASDYPFKITGYLAEALSNQNVQYKPLCEFEEISRQLYICINGDVLHDTLHWKIAGNIYNQSIEDIWRNTVSNKKRQKMKTIPSRCLDCFATGYCLSYQTNACTK